MRWQQKIKIKPGYEDRRVIVKFAFLPVLCNTTWIWLEKYLVIQYYRWNLSHHGNGFKWVTTEKRYI